MPSKLRINSQLQGLGTWCSFNICSEKCHFPRASICISRSVCQTFEEKCLHRTQKDHTLMETKIKNLLKNEEMGELLNEVEDLRSRDPGSQAHNTRKRNTGKEICVRDRVQFKRKKAKGPNPLSCKKKKRHENPNSGSVKFNLQSRT